MSRDRYIPTARSKGRIRLCKCRCALVRGINGSNQLKCPGCEARAHRIANGMPPTFDGSDCDRFGRETRSIASVVGLEMKI